MSPAVAILIAATLAFLGAMTSLQQKRRVDRRAAWWERARWALDLSFAADDNQSAVGSSGLLVLTTQGDETDLALIDRRLAQLFAQEQTLDEQSLTDEYRAPDRPEED